ncbi:hypothetical protein [Pseudomonas fluorescens]|uniref:Uncharacterized protein n=1 Tax=Pseudomonas fluorescens TaxID=294 RepID=A0A5E7V0T3_PSEFL|nr:hypothetical protein [Pseudomonas fluorescens]VVQ16100.1 hypothetical protein PS928_04338 [Pseudomonas fluorescens]
MGLGKTDASSFVETLPERPAAQPMLILDKELTFTLITGYSVKLRHTIVKRWLELEGSGFERVSVQAAVDLSNASRTIGELPFALSKRGHGVP